jgi:hypothetical protein
MPTVHAMTSKSLCNTSTLDTFLFMTDHVLHCLLLGVAYGLAEHATADSSTARTITPMPFIGACDLESMQQTACRYCIAAYCISSMEGFYSQS